MQRSAGALLERWHADLAVAGAVKKPGEVLSLWFVPRAGGGTLGPGDQPYKLEDVRLGEDSHGDLRSEIAAIALAAVAPLAYTETRGRVIDRGLMGSIRCSVGCQLTIPLQTSLPMNVALRCIDRTPGPGYNLLTNTPLGH